MDFNGRIENIKPYFKTFNICEDVAYVLVKFPNKWSLFDKESICKEYNIAIEPRNEGIYFLCELKDGTDGIFNAIEFIIENNNALEEKTTLLQEKVKELGELFASETLEKLKTLEFTFSKKNSVKSKKNKVKTEIEVVKEYDLEEELIKEKISENLDNEATVIHCDEVLCPNEVMVATVEDDTVSLKTKKKKGKKVINNNEQDSSMMDFAKSLL